MLFRRTPSDGAGSSDKTNPTSSIRWKMSSFFSFDFAVRFLLRLRFFFSVLKSSWLPLRMGNFGASRFESRLFVNPSWLSSVEFPTLCFEDEVTTLLVTSSPNKSFNRSLISELEAEATQRLYRCSRSRDFRGLRTFSSLPIRLGGQRG